MLALHACLRACMLTEGHQEPEGLNPLDMMALETLIGASEHSRGRTVRIGMIFISMRILL